MKKVVHVGILIITSLLATSSVAELPEIGANDFSCIRDMTPVRGFFVSNVLGNTEATVKVATAGTGEYPEGSVVQLVPSEVMVKHHKGFSPATKDWEFFELDVASDTSSIRGRGFVDVVNRFGGNCFACHIKANPGRDLICETGHGCDTIPLTPLMIKAIQNTDPRCDAMELPAEQVEALKALQAATSNPEA
ncbi:MAG: hypothetical protein AB8B86_18825 [Pseudomonadales bacterium]